MCKHFEHIVIQLLTLSISLTTAPASKSSCVAPGFPSSQAQCKGLRRYYTKDVFVLITHVSK